MNVLVTLSQMQNRKISKRYKLDQSPFYCLCSRRKLAEILHTTPNQLKAILSNKKLYIGRNKDISKKSSDKPKFRYIEEPITSLKRIQKRVAFILSCIELPDFVYSPAKGKSCISNAKLHQSNSVLMSLDIKKFFPSTSSQKVCRFFSERMRCSPDVSAILVSLLTYKGRLPTGSPSSPIMSYYAHINMWESINQIVKKVDCAFSLWVDDITISGNEIPEQTKIQVKKAIKNNGLSYHKEKHYKKNSIKEVTGIIIAKGKLKSPNRHHLARKNLKQKILNQTDPDIKCSLIRSLKGLEVQMSKVV